MNYNTLSKSRHSESICFKLPPAQLVNTQHHPLLLIRYKETTKSDLPFQVESRWQKQFQDNTASYRSLFQSSQSLILSQSAFKCHFRFRGRDVCAGAYSGFTDVERTGRGRRRPRRFIHVKVASACITSNNASILDRTVLAI